MQGISDTQNDFTLRLKRIEATSAARTQRLFVGEDESYVVPVRGRKVKQSGLAVLTVRAWRPLSMALAVLLGGSAHAIGMVGRFWVEGLHDWSANPDVEMIKQLALGFAIAMILGYGLALRGATLTALKLLGVAVGVLFFHNAVHLYPQVFAKATSPEWVSEMLAHTKAQSLLWRGITFPI